MKKAANFDQATSSAIRWTGHHPMPAVTHSAKKLTPPTSVPPICAPGNTCSLTHQPGEQDKSYDQKNKVNSVQQQITVMPVVNMIPLNSKIFE
jgi:hypothetical protein